MEKVYYYVGFGIVWIIIGIITLALSCFLFWLIGFLFAKIWKENFFFNFYIRRKRFETEKLRIAYVNYYDNKLFTKYTVKFRLRNIKDIKK